MPALLGTESTKRLAEMGGGRGTLSERPLLWPLTSENAKFKKRKKSWDGNTQSKKSTRLLSLPATGEFFWRRSHSKKAFLRCPSWVSRPLDDRRVACFRSESLGSRKSSQQRATGFRPSNNSGSCAKKRKQKRRKAEENVIKARASKMDRERQRYLPQKFQL